MTAERGFTPAQMAAVSAADGPLGIIAGPGTGKTTVLAGRVAHLVRVRGADPSSVLIVTFTADAARALRRQIGQELGAVASDLAIHTLHAFGRKVITTWSSQFGFDSRPTVLPVDEGRALLATVAADQGWDLDAFPLADLAAAVDRCRLQADPVARRADPLADLADAFQERLQRRNVLDFASMVALPLQLFREDERALRVLQDAFRWLVVDEVQDLDATQVALLQLLAAQHRNLVVAGDPAQSIYAFRGADTRFLLGFDFAFPGARCISLDHNFRASGSLVELANALNELLAYRPAQVTDNPLGPPARLYAADDEQAEATFVANQIGVLVDRGLLPHPGHAAVLYRSNSQADRLAAALREAGVPYARHGQGDLFSARVVRDALAYLRLARNPDDRVAVTRVINVPPRGLSRLAASLVDQPSTSAALPARAAEIDPKETSVSAAAGFVALVYDLHALAGRGLAPAALLDRALDRSGYLGWLERHPEGIQRLHVLDRLRAVARRADAGLDDWLDGLALGENVDPVPEVEAARLSSIHQAKGSEWRATFVPGLEEGILPHYRALCTERSSPGEAVVEEALREELRVGYVALTRPRERLYLSYCRTRERSGQLEARQPSRWLYALPPELLAAG